LGYSIFFGGDIAPEGTHARIGSLTADRERFMPWKTIAGDTLADGHAIELEVLLQGSMKKRDPFSLLRSKIFMQPCHAARIMVVGGIGPRSKSKTCMPTFTAIWLRTMTAATNFYKWKPASTEFQISTSIRPALVPVF
jgi:hypothetical protein